MKKINILNILIKLIFLVVFNALFFILGGFEHNASVWIAYAMIQIAYLMFAFTPLFIKNGKTAVETGAPLSYVSGINFMIHLVIGLIFIFVAPESWKFEVVIYIIMVAVYLVVFFSICMTNARTESDVARRSVENFFIKNQSSKIKSLIGRASDAELNKLLETAYDNMHASPARSSGAVASIEASITTKVCELEMAIMDNRIDDAKKSCREILYFIEERKRILSINY